MITEVKKYTIVLGNCYEVIKEIESNSIDLIVTDPPYQITTTKKATGYIGKALKRVEQELADNELTKGIDLSILDEFMRIMKKPNIYIFCNKAQILDYLNYFVGVHRCAFDILVWIKSNPVPAYGTNYLNDKEFCLYFRKGIKLTTTYESGKTYWISPTNVKDKKKYEHPTVKPQWIIEMLIQNSSKPNDIVLDCFLGSGTTAVAAKTTGRAYIGIEQSPKFFETSVKRINFNN